MCTLPISQPGYNRARTPFSRASGGRGEPDEWVRRGAELEVRPDWSPLAVVTCWNDKAKEPAPPAAAAILRESGRSDSLSAATGTQALQSCGVFVDKCKKTALSVLSAQ